MICKIFRNLILILACTSNGIIAYCHSDTLRVMAYNVLYYGNGCQGPNSNYHGYLKNIALALSGKMDSHFTALWDGGHIKFFSIKTLNELFSEQDVSKIKVLRVGRIPVFAKSMVAVVRIR